MNIIRNSFVIDPLKGISKDKKDIIYNNNIIIEIRNSVSANEDIKYDVDIDCKGRLVSPGLIDIHSHFRDPGQTHKEDLISGSNAASKGGYTTVVIMPNTTPPIDSVEKISEIIKKSLSLPVRIFVAPCITKNREGKELVNLKEIIESFGDRIFGFSDDGDHLKDDNLLKKALNILDGKYPILNHAEDLDEASNNGSVNYGIVSKKFNLIGRPESAEIKAIKRDLEIAKESNGWIHIQHVSCEKSLELINNAKKEGVKVTCEVTPHHLFFNENILENILDSTFKVNPPLRTKNDMNSCLEALKNNLLDVIATDHAPHSIAEKSGVFQETQSGIAWLENSFGIVSKNTNYKFACEKMAYNPGHLFSSLFQMKLGMIKKGYKPDFNIIDDVNWNLNLDSLESKSSNYIINNHNEPIELLGKTVMTILNGDIKFNSGELEVKIDQR
jgi:dihydroorotase